MRNLRVSYRVGNDDGEERRLKIPHGFSGSARAGVHAAGTIYMEGLWPLQTTPERSIQNLRFWN